MSQSLSVSFPAPTGVIARYVGSTGGSTTRYYWVQAIYPSGFSILGESNALANTLAGLDRNNQVYAEWNPMAGAIGYLVFYTTTSTAPTQGSILLGVTTAPNFTDQGQSNSANLQTGTVVGNGGFNVARAQYNFAIDGGGALITLAVSDIIPAGAIIVGATINPTTALVGATATIAVGTSAGSAANSIKAATAVASYSLDALLNGTATLAAPVKMSAAGTVTITTATAALSAGVMEIFVYYVTAINL